MSAGEFCYVYHGGLSAGGAKGNRMHRSLDFPRMHSVISNNAAIVQSLLYWSVQYDSERLGDN